MDRLPPPVARAPTINRGATMLLALQPAAEIWDNSCSSKKLLRTTEGGEELHENAVKQKGGNSKHSLSIIVSGM